MQRNHDDSGILKQSQNHSQWLWLINHSINDDDFRCYHMQLNKEDAYSSSMQRMPSNISSWVVHHQ